MTGEQRLTRYHDISLSQSGVWRILRRLQLSRLPTSQRYRRHQERWKRYEKPEPGHQVQIDVKCIAPLKGARRKHWQFTAINDCTRLRALRLHDRLGQKSPIQFIDYVLEKLPFHVQRIQTDNGSEFQAAFHWHVLDRGIEHVYIKPATPRLSGKVERSHRIDAEDFYRMLGGVVVDDSTPFTSKLQEWEDFHNSDRPHGALGGQTPHERLRQKVGGSSVSGQRQLHNGRPYRTVLEPTTSRKGPEKRLVDLLTEHYDELEHLLTVTGGTGEVKPGNACYDAPGQLKTVPSGS